MKIVANGSGMMSDFIDAMGATVRGRFIDIPKDKGGGFITGFSWGNDLRMMIRNYYLNEDVLIEWTNESVQEQQHVIFLLSGIFPQLISSDRPLEAEKTNVLICTQLVTSMIDMPAHTNFGSVIIGVSRNYLYRLFGQLTHPVIRSILEANNTFVYETTVSPQMLKTTDELVRPTIAECLESQYYKLKCEELLCHIFTLLLQREALPATRMHIEDIKTIYAVRNHLQTHLNEPPSIASLAREVGMSEPKLRKLFKQTFGKGVFELYQSTRMQEAARMLKEKQLSVSEVGYQLGFTNLSHFSRVFEEYMGSKPKKYSVT